MPLDNMFDRKGMQAGTYQQVLFLLQGGTVRRFHTTDVLKEQTIAAHSWGVAMFCWLLTNGRANARLLLAAMCHDLAEQVWGDIPSPAKRELGVIDQLTAMEERTLDENYFHFALSAGDEAVLNAADCMDGLLHAVRERRLGNRNMEVVWQRYYGYIKSLNLTDPVVTEVLEALETLWQESLSSDHCRAPHPKTSTQASGK